MDSDDHSDRNSWKIRHRSKIADAEPGDEIGTWPRDLLLKMDKRFCQRLTAAIASGREHPPAKSERTDSRS
jgi:hypothetical protein